MKDDEMLFHHCIVLMIAEIQRCKNGGCHVHQKRKIQSLCDEELMNYTSSQGPGTQKRVQKVAIVYGCWWCFCGG